MRRSRLAAGYVHVFSGNRLQSSPYVSCSDFFRLTFRAFRRNFSCTGGELDAAFELRGALQTRGQFDEPLSLWGVSFCLPRQNLEPADEHRAQQAAESALHFSEHIHTLNEEGTPFRANFALSSSPLLLIGAKIGAAKFLGLPSKPAVPALKSGKENPQLDNLDGPPPLVWNRERNSKPVVFIGSFARSRDRSAGDLFEQHDHVRCKLYLWAFSD